MSIHDETYNGLIYKIQADGELRTDRTGVGTQGLFGLQATYDLQEGFPLLTTKKIHWRSIVLELLWFLRGETNIKTLGCGIWDEWADAQGELGPIYGKQWRSWEVLGGYIDQITKLVRDIKANPSSRRHIVSAWNVADIEDMKLPPCHIMFQCYVRQGQFLDLQMYQRSGDMFLGVPFNIASYSLLLMLIAQATGYRPGRFIHTLGDAHIYRNHLDQVEHQLSRSTNKPAPQVHLGGQFGEGSLDTFTVNDISLSNYDPYPAIKAPVAV